MLAKEVVTYFVTELIVPQVALARLQPKCIWFDDCIPVARFCTNRAVASVSAQAKVNVGFKPNGSAVAATEIGLDHQILHGVVVWAVAPTVK